MVVGAIIAAATPVLLKTVLQAEQSRRASPSPKIKPGELLKLALDIQALSEQGLTPIISTDPFLGGLVLSTSDQSSDLFDILGQRFASQALAATPEETAAILQARTEQIETRRIAAAIEPDTPTLRDEVVAALATTTAKMVAPGIVARKSSSLTSTSRLGGPCAGANTGFSRLNCARGGFS